MVYHPGFRNVPSVCQLGSGFFCIAVTYAGCLAADKNRLKKQGMVPRTVRTINESSHVIAEIPLEALGD